MIDALLQMMNLKDEVRSGWLIRGVEAPESVADHSWSTAMLCLTYAGEADVDRTRAVEMALVHDLAESITGDIATRVAFLNDKKVAARKQEREAAAMDELLRSMGAGNPAGCRIRDLWEEYEARESPEALFVRDMNLIDMCMQAFLYEKAGRYAETEEITNDQFPDHRGLDEFFATSEPRIGTGTGVRLFADVSDRYRELPSVRARSLQ